MELYLPIAEMSVHWLMILAMGVAAGFLSGVFGLQFGVRAGARLRGEQLRFFLALLTLAIAIRPFYGPVVTPLDAFSLSIGDT